MGKFHFKNVSAPLEVFALTNDGLVVPDKGKLEGKLEEKKVNRGKTAFIATLLLLVAVSIFVYRKFTRSAAFTGNEKSIAVLPFDNISNDSLQQYFSDGITEDIITQLSKSQASKSYPGLL
jgi:hypothetical protein